MNNSVIKILVIRLVHATIGAGISKKTRGETEGFTIWNSTYIYRSASENVTIVISFHIPDMAVVLMRGTAAFPIII